MDNYKTVLADLLEEHNYVERDRFSKDDFVTIICPEHGVYYKTVGDILEGEPECPKCKFRCEKRAQEIIEESKVHLDEDPVLVGEDALYYRLLITHKKSGLIFQKIGMADDLEDFKTFWNPWKWKDFEIEVIDQIEGTLAEVEAIIHTFQKNNSDLKITLPSSLKFNINKTYMWSEVWQAKSKTVPVLREIMLTKQKGNCTVCKKPVAAPTLDHEHIKKVKGTGYIRAVCCSQCNTFIARSENNAARHGISLEELPNVLRNIADHLENKTKVIHPTEQPKRKKVGIREWNKVVKYYFKIYPNRNTLPKKPTYVTESWLELKREVDEYILNEELSKRSRKKKPKVLMKREDMKKDEINE